MVLNRPAAGKYSHKSSLVKSMVLTRRLYKTDKKTTLNPKFFQDFLKKTKRIKGRKSDAIAIYTKVVVIEIVFSNITTNPRI